MLGNLIGDLILTGMSVFLALLCAGMAYCGGYVIVKGFRMKPEPRSFSRAGEIIFLLGALPLLLFVLLTVLHAPLWAALML